MTLHICEYISPRLRTRANGEYVCFAMRMTRQLYMDMGSGETSAGVRAFRSVYLIILVLTDFVVCGCCLTLERILATNEHEYPRIEARKCQPNNLSDRK